MTYRVSKLPYAVLIDEEGVLRAKGLVNTREHLEKYRRGEADGNRVDSGVLKTRHVHDHDHEHHE